MLDMGSWALLPTPQVPPASVLLISMSHMPFLWHLSFSALTPPSSPLLPSADKRVCPKK